VGRFAEDPEYTLEWPPELFQHELRRLMERLPDREDRALEEISHLLGEAFVSRQPREDWERLRQLGWDPDEEPF
jgi:hypothetical protein